MIWLALQLWPWLVLAALVGAATTYHFSIAKVRSERFVETPVEVPEQLTPAAKVEVDTAPPQSNEAQDASSDVEFESPFPVLSSDDPAPWQEEELWSKPARVSAEPNRSRDEWSEAATNWRDWADAAAGKHVDADSEDELNGDSEIEPPVLAEVTTRAKARPEDWDMFAADREIDGGPDTDGPESDEDAPAAADPFADYQPPRPVEADGVEQDPFPDQVAPHPAETVEFAAARADDVAREEHAHGDGELLEAERLAWEREQQHREERERAEREQIEAERLAWEREEQERMELERLESEQMEAERLAWEREQREQIEAEQAAWERLQYKLQERLGSERAEQQRVHEAHAEVERLEAERVETERLEQERLEVERLGQERLEAERAEAERLEQERAEAERVEQERLETERLEAERLEAERAEAERLEQERAEAERVELERLEAERLEAERLEAERAEAERLEAERAEAERAEAVRLEQERAEADRLEAERAEAERLEAERIEAERLEAERAAEAERLEQERLEAERLEAERLEQERAAAERLEQERLEAERLEAERLEQERAEAERLEAERVETERLETERLEAERLEQERLENERLAGLEAQLADMQIYDADGETWDVTATPVDTEPEYDGAPTTPYGPGSANAPFDGSQPEGYPVKGNESTRLYHTKKSWFFSRTQADVWFESEQAAEEAGFTRWDRRVSSAHTINFQASQD